MKHLLFAFILAPTFALLAPAVQAWDFDAELTAIQQDWATANYATPAGDRQVQAFDALERRAEAFVKANPQRAEPLIWQGIVLSTYAGAKGGLGALNLAKRSRAALEAALAIDPNALDGSAYTSLGTLYFKVPGFPLGFGSKTKAREYLERALALNPSGIDPNFFYGEFLLEQDRRAEALSYLEKARSAPARPGRELADAGRRKEIDAMIARVAAER
jgi:tetratricopeptide (TPR) repeat protein